MKKIEKKSKSSRIINIIRLAVGIMILLVNMYACSTGPSAAERTVMLAKMDMVAEKIEPDVNTVKKDTLSNTEEYDRIYENPFKEALQNPLSTFSIDVDKASYSNLRRFIESGTLPPKDAIRIEEMINYFSYHYPQPTNEHPFAIYTENAECPWNKDHQLVQIGLQGKSLDYEHLKASNLVFLIDVSGSMDDSNKLPLVKKSLNLMLQNLQPIDKVALVVYAGAAGVVLPSTSLDEKDKIISAIENLKAGGSTAGGAGIQLAYDIAKSSYIADGNNRVILCTDGDFNIGASSTSEMVRLIEEKRKENIYLTICGFGMGNYKDGRLEQISRAGNGNYFYIDQEKEAQKVFVKELRANMFTIAKDVKIQVEFNPEKVKAYRLIGYENRVMANEDFNNDLKDAGELGAGHTVTALYEIIPKGAPASVQTTDPLKYQKSTLTDKAKSGEMVTIKFRYKPIGSETSKLIVKTVGSQCTSLKSTSSDLRFAAAVAGFGMLLRESTFKGDATYNSIYELAENAITDKTDEEKSELLDLIKKAKNITKTKD
jgi:Ca-activated chloride channel homolog